MKTWIKYGGKFIREDVLPLVVPMVVTAIGNKIIERFPRKDVNARNEHGETALRGRPLGPPNHKHSFPLRGWNSGYAFRFCISLAPLALRVGQLRKP